MVTQILEGTLSEVQERLSELPLKPDTRLRVIVTESSVTETPIPSFRPTEFRNGLPLLPRRELPAPITIELVKRLSEDDDEEILRAYRVTGR